MRVERGFLFCSRIGAPSSYISLLRGYCTFGRISTTYPFKIRGKSHVSTVTIRYWCLGISPRGVSALMEVGLRMASQFLWEVASCIMLLFGLTCCRLYSILNSLSARNCECFYCTRLHMIFSKSVAPWIQKLASNSWRSGRFSYPGIMGSDWGLCEGSTIRNWCMDMKNGRVWNTHW